MVWEVATQVAEVEARRGALDDRDTRRAGVASTDHSRPVADNVPLSLADAERVEDWCRRHDISVDQLVDATRMVGLMPAALDFYLSSRGRPTKKVTAEMRAARPLIAPRDRRRKKVGVPI